MGYVMLGIAASYAATPGGTDAMQKIIDFKQLLLTVPLLQMVSHGLITGALFFLVGVIYERAHTRDLNSFGGLGVNLPVYAGFFMLFAMASLGLPGLCGFVGEFLVFLGAYGVGPYATGLIIPLQIIVALSLLGVVLTAGYMLWSVQRIFMGPLNEKWKHLNDMSVVELGSLTPLRFFTVFLGIYPALVSDMINISVLSILQ
jgi:NADH-quinone oxidoreductase subunit M